MATLTADGIEAGHVLTLDGKDYAVFTVKRVPMSPEREAVVIEGVALNDLRTHSEIAGAVDWTIHPDTPTRYFAFGPKDTVYYC